LPQGESAGLAAAAFLASLLPAQLHALLPSLLQDVDTPDRAGPGTPRSTSGRLATGSGWGLNKGAQIPAVQCHHLSPPGTGVLTYSFPSVGGANACTECRYSSFHSEQSHELFRAGRCKSG
jgi:hypothetical protein